MSSRERLIIVDVNNLAVRNWYAFSKKPVKPLYEPIAFGILRDLRTLTDVLGGGTFALCFDCPAKNYIRRQLYSGYKVKSKLEEHRNAHRNKQMERELNVLRNETLPELGFSNIFCEKDFEADDLMACVCNMPDAAEEMILVTSDKDVYQLLDGDSVIAWSPATKEYMSEEMVQEKYGIHPTSWISYRAMIGEPSDCIKGVPGIGEVKARQYLAGTATDAIREAVRKHRDIVLRNFNLIQLPYYNLPELELEIHNDILNAGRWDEMTEKYGPGLVGRCPLSS